VIVTGAASGIGRASALLFAAEGGKVVGADRTAGVHQTVADIRGKGGKAEAMEMDVGAASEVAALVEFAEKTYGRLDVVSANSGSSGGMPTLFEQSEEGWHAILQVNLIGPMLAIQIAAPVLVKNGGGAIVCTASVAGLRSGAGSPAYSASKAGVINLVATAAQQRGRTNIRGT